MSHQSELNLNLKISPNVCFLRGQMELGTVLHVSLIRKQIWPLKRIYGSNFKVLKYNIKKTIERIFVNKIGK